MKTPPGFAGNAPKRGVVDPTVRCLLSLLKNFRLPDSVFVNKPTHQTKAFNHRRMQYQALTRADANHRTCVCSDLNNFSLQRKMQQLGPFVPADGD